MSKQQSYPQITASEVGAPPPWALQERNLIAQMEEAALPVEEPSPPRGDTED